MSDSIFYKNIVKEVQALLPEGAVFVLAIGEPEEQLPDGSIPFDFKVLTNTSPEQSRLIMRDLGGKELDSVAITDRGKFVLEEIERTGCSLREAIERANELNIGGPK